MSGEDTNGKLPTFDEWFEQLYDEPFDAAFFIPGNRQDDYLKALSEHMRKYISLMIQRIGAR